MTRACGRSQSCAAQYGLFKVWIIAVAGIEDNDLHIQKERVSVLTAEQQEEDEGQETTETFLLLQIGV